jgi:hypothetical protein
MNILPFNTKPVHTEIYGTSSLGGRIAMGTDAQGRPALYEDAVQTIAATAFDIRSLSGGTDSANITATAFDIRSLDSGLDSILASANTFFVTSGTATLLLGGTVVLSVDTSPYSSSAFLIRADAISLLTTVFLQLAPVDTATYYVTVASESSLILGGRYLLVPTMPLRYARIFATGVGSRLTAYYVGQV